MWDLIVSVPDHCLSFYFSRDEGHCISAFWLRYDKQIPSHST